VPAVTDHRYGKIGGRMKETLGWLIITMGLAGCTSLWVPPTQDHATYDHDLMYCRTAANAAVMMSRDPSYRRGWFIARLRDCMRARGWPVQDEDRWSHELITEADVPF
jgi:hypothetical protein